MRAHQTLSTTSSVIALAFLALLGTGTHTVSRGETLAAIAARHGTTAAALSQANGISNPNRILAGARLTIPGSAAPATPTAATPTTTSYGVQRGDTLGSIASKAGTSIATLVTLNGIKNANLIRIGQVLALPTVSAGPASAPSVPGTPSPATTTTPAGGAAFHVVRSGDTIGRIASTYAISQEQLVTANGLTNNRVYVGQRLRLIPAAKEAPTPPTSVGATHAVASGQTLSSIAQRFGTTIRAIQDANGITDPNLVRIGQTLKIPGTSAGSASLVCPIQGPMQHMNDWGFPRSGGRFHEGNDLFAARGTPAAAVVSGTVLQTVGRIGGKQVKLLGDDGVSYYYTHLDQFGASGKVAAGAIVGYVGSSGNAAGGATHVHFEVHPGGGAAVNPFPRISAVC